MNEYVEDYTTEYYEISSYDFDLIREEIVNVHDQLIILQQSNFQYLQLYIFTFYLFIAIFVSISFMRFFKR